LFVVPIPFSVRVFALGYTHKPGSGVRFSVLNFSFVFRWCPARLISLVL
jgi:hypothetical protein